MYSVFISYSNTDAQDADKICSLLDKLKVSYFRDKKNIEWGESINNEVRSALDNSQSVLMIVSPSSLKSVWVPYEVGYCSALNRKILPYLTHPSLDVPGYIADVKHLSCLDELAEYFSQSIRHSEIPLTERPRRLPDVRVTFRNAIDYRDQKPIPVVVFSVANHDKDPVYFNNVSLITNEVSLQITNDPISGNPYYPRMLRPGERRDVKITRDAFESSHTFAPNGIDPTSVKHVVARDDIGREFFADSSNLSQVLLELFRE